MTRGLVRLVALLCSVLLAASSMNAATVASRFNGRPKFDEGKALGYFVWRDGDTWKVRWTTFGATHRFSGRVTVDSGEFTALKRIDVDAERRVIAPGRPSRVYRGARGRVRAARPGSGAVVQERTEDHIVQETERLLRFDTETDDDIDGFDFKTRGGVRELRLLLEIDGVRRPTEIEVGRDNFKPGEDPLVVMLHQ